MALSAAAVCSYMGAYWFLWQSIVSILVIPVYEKAMYDAIIVVILMILRGILNIASATCSHCLGFRLETNLRKNGLHKLLDASSSFFDHNSSGEIRKIIDDNAAETHKTVAHLIPDNVTAVMTPVLMFVLMFAIDYRLGILLILTTVIGVLQYRKMSGGTEFLSGYSAALQKMSAATVEYVRGMQIIKIFGVTVQYYKTLINSIKEYKQYVYQYSLSCKNPYVGFQVLFNVFYAFAVPAAVVFISYGEPAMLILAKIVFFAVFSGAVFTSFTSIMFTGQDNFGAQNTLNQLDGSFCALVGESGSGKSTLAQLMCGLLVPSSGEVLFEGKNISLCRGKQKQVLRSKIQLILQDGKGAMDPRFTVYQIIAEPIRNFRKLSKKEEEREINDLLTMMELPEEIKLRKAHELSGGQQKRVCIARALAAQPDVLIFDEAVSGLDVLVRKHILDLLKRLHQERKMTCFFITHDLDVALYLADRVMVMRCGKIIEDRTFHGSTDCFTHPYTKLLLHSIAPYLG